jgi:hypothetical protein
VSVWERSDGRFGGKIKVEMPGASKDVLMTDESESKRVSLRVTPPRPWLTSHDAGSTSLCQPVQDPRPRGSFIAARFVATY